MEQKELKKIFGKIEAKVGKDNAGKIADDLGVILTDNETMNKSLQSKDDEITSLKKNNELLVSANGNLLQQIGMGDEDPFEQKRNETKEEKKKYNLSDSFDEKGNFK